MRILLLLLLVASICYCSDEVVTCRSILKLVNTGEGSRLHSHDVKYGSGSQQQSVTGVTNSDDINSHWQIFPALNKNCDRGDHIKCGSSIRLKHLSTGCFLHSHHFRAPLTTNAQEVSCFGGEKDSDTGDDWQLDCDDDVWKAFDNIKLKHVVTGKYLALSGNQYNRPIHGQREVVGVDGPNYSRTEWRAAEGVYMMPTSKDF